MVLLVRRVAGALFAAGSVPALSGSESSPSISSADNAGGNGEHCHVRQHRAAGPVGSPRSHRAPPRGGSRPAVRNSWPPEDVQALWSGLGPASRRVSNLGWCREGGACVSARRGLPRSAAGWRGAGRRRRGARLGGLRRWLPRLGRRGWRRRPRVRLGRGSRSMVRNLVRVPSWSSALPAVGVGGVRHDLAGGTAGRLIRRPPRRQRGPCPRG